MSSGGEIGEDTDKNSDHVRPIYLANAEIFAYDEWNTSGWVPLAPTKVPTSIAFDDTQGGIHRIIAVDGEGHRVIVNSIVSSSFDFHRTSDKFGHWADQATGTVYGIGFASDYEQHEFLTILERCKASQQCRKPSNNRIRSPSRSKGVLQNPNFGSNLLNQVPLPKNTQDMRATLLPQQSRSGRGDHSKTKYALEDLRVKAPLNKVRLVKCDSAGEESCREKSYAKKATTGLISYSKISLMEKGASPTELSKKKKHMHETIRNLYKENSELKRTLKKSAEKVRQWEKEMEELKIKNCRLVQQVKNKTTELEQCKQAGFGLQQEVDRLKEAERSSEHNLKNAEALEQTLESLKEEKKTLKTTVTNMAVEDETETLTTDSNTVLDCSRSDFEYSKDAAGLDEQYKKVLKSVESQVEEVRKAKTEGQVVLEKLGPTFLQTIHELISVQGQVKAAYQQQQKVIEVSQQSHSNSCSTCIPKFPS